MAVYQSGIKGLFTESNPQDTPPETMKDAQDVVILRDNLAESRHGVNVQGITRSTGNWNDSFSVTNSKLTVLKVDFDEAQSGNVRKYVLLSEGSNGMQELNTATDLTGTITTNLSAIPTTYAQKPIGFTFDQSLYIVGATGWQEMKKDVLDSGATGVKKVIQWPGFTDIGIETFQDTQDFSANWFDINKKVGIRFTYVWNTRYNDEQPREVESEPSQIFEVLHPMALRTQASGSTVSNTIKDKSRIRVRIGSNFTRFSGPFENYVTSTTNGRRYKIRVYRTKQVDIGEALPTEYFQAFPDIEIGDSTKYTFGDSAVNTTAETVDFGSTEAPRWANGSTFVYRPSSGGGIGGLADGTIYYLGNRSGNTYQIFTSNLLTSPVNLSGPFGNVTHNFVRVYEANLTVNDDGIISLPQLYTNPNLDGIANGNAIPPIANSVIEYKNYHVAADIREPLRAYVSLVTQPLVKHIETNDTVTMSATPVSISTLTAASSLGYDTSGITANNFRADSQFWYDNYPLVTNVSGNELTFSPPSTTQFNAAYSANNFILPAMVTLFQSNATFSIRLDETTSFSVQVNPKYNRQGLYKRSTDKNLEYLQFAGKLVDTNVQRKEYNRTSTTFIVGTQRGQTPADVTATGDNTITLSNNVLTVTVSSTTTADSAPFEEPGIFGIAQSNTTQLFFPSYFTYKTVSSDTNRNILFNTISPIGNVTAFPIPATGQDAYMYYIEGSSLFSAPLYHVAEPTITSSLRWDSNVGFDGGTPQQTYFSYRKLTGYYDQPVAIRPSANDNNITLLGPLAKSPAQLLDDCVSELVTNLNSAAVTAGVNCKFVKTDNVGEFYVEYYAGTKIEARIEGDYHTYEPEIVRSTTEWTTLAEYKKNNERAVSISRYNAPEAFPNSSILAPILVGSDKSRIVALAKNANDCYILKEDGIWRLSIVGNSSVANVDAVVQIDTTTFCQAPYSVKEINEEIIFLSQKGFISIAGNDIEPIGRPIETEVKEKLQRCIANGLTGQIRAWVNEEKRIYGCTIPDTTTSFTTYVFSTYTRQWTKFSLPVVDAVSDSQGRTLYAVGMPTLTLGAGATLQAQVQAATSGTTTRFYLAEELHTQGLFRNESDQWDYRYIPATVTLGTGNQVVLTDNSSATLPPWVRMGGSGSDITTSGLAFFTTREAYYKKSGVYYPCTLVSRTSTTVTVEFTSVPAGITTVAGDDGLYAGVPASITFNPSNIGSPNTLKMFSEYQLHVVEAISKLSMQFITDSRGTFSSPRVFAFNRTAVNRTVYRTFIPLEMMRGRWLIRKVDHSVPGERLQAASQSLSVRDTGSTLIQKAPR